MEGHIQNFTANGDHIYYICLLQLKFVSKYESMIILLQPCIILFHTDTVVHIDIVKITRTFLQYRLCIIHLCALVGHIWSTGCSLPALP